MNDGSDARPWEMIVSDRVGDSWIVSHLAAFWNGGGGGGGDFRVYLSARK